MIIELNCVETIMKRIVDVSAMMFPFAEVAFQIKRMKEVAVNESFTVVSVSPESSFVDDSFAQVDDFSTDIQTRLSDQVLGVQIQFTSIDCLQMT